MIERIKLFLCLMVLTAASAVAEENREADFLQQINSDSFDFYKVLTITIKSPAEQVWSYMGGKKRNCWMADEVIFKNLQGDIGEKGEILKTLPAKDRADSVYPVNYFKVIDAVSGQHGVVKIYRQENQTADLHLVAYNISYLREKNGSTELMFFQIWNLPANAYSQAEYQQLKSSVSEFLSGNFMDLKAYLESDSVNKRCG